jgi:hypothetical protein
MPFETAKNVIFVCRYRENAVGVSVSAMVTVPIDTSMGALRRPASPSTAFFIFVLMSWAKPPGHTKSQSAVKNTIATGVRKFFIFPP